ncbi:uncharacterized protein L199_001334 [Kwoniella botswanensis]|uniref:uncharacterized protein n=1 Tax=Kwoniella botswanensis TaxID=1268659 RepID=UPI00315CB31D
MELRPYLPPDGVGSNDVHTGTGVGMGYEYGGLPPIVGTVRPEDVMKAPNPSNSDSIHGSSGSGSGKGTSSAYNTSIQSFPSPSVRPPQSVNPPTISRHHSGIIHPTSSGSSNPPIPTSFPHRSSNNNNITSPAWSSPIPPNANVPSHVSSTELSSNRPLFSSTQGSAIPPPITPDAHPRPSVIKTYGKAASSGRTPSPQKNPIILSSPPVIRGGSTSPTKKRKNIVLSDDSDEEEEPIEFRTPLPIPPSKGPTPKSRVEVVLPTSRPSSALANKTHDTRPSSSQESGRHHSPDPLDSLNGSGQSPMKGINQPSSSAMTSGSSRRVSSRVAENKAKELAEKEERRRKRREEKEKKKLEGEAKDNKGKPKSPVKDKSPMKDKDKSLVSEKGSMVEPIEIEESLEMEVQIDNPPQPPAKSDVIETRGKKRKSDVSAPIIDQNDQDEDFNPSSSRKGKKAKKGKKESVKKGKAAQKKVVEPEPEPEPEQEQEQEKIVETTNKVMEEDLMQEEKREEPEEVSENVLIVIEQSSETHMSRMCVRPPKSPTPPPPSPTKSVSPARPPLRATSSNVSTPSASSINHRPSPGPITKDGTPSAPGGIRWKAPRNDLTTVLAKFGGAKRSGLTKKLRIAPLHQKIGPPAKALPPVPKKPEKKKGASDDEDDEDDEDEDGEKKVGKGTMEWFMVED